MDQAEKYQQLVGRLAEIVDLMRVSAVLGWDQQVNMPKGGMKARGEQTATITSLAHARFTSPETGDLLQDLSGYAQQLPHASDEASMIRVAQREYEKRTRIPPELVAELARAETAGYGAWIQAREAQDFGIFRPALERLVKLMLEVSTALGYKDSPIDAFVDQSEPGMRMEQIDKLFAELRETLVPLVRAINERPHRVEDSFIYRNYDRDAQWKLGLEAVRAIGFDLDTRGREDISVHPFTTSFSPDDVRITTRVRENEFTMAYYASLHEAGHGLYEQGLPRHLDRTVLCNGASGGTHESQSRLWENIVGRSHEFCEWAYPAVRRYFPTQTEGVSLETFYGGVNRVKPSFIRVQADEVTYNLHIMIRTELEQAVLNGQLAVSELESAWNEKYKQYLGIVPKNPVEGVLQDIHWSGRFGGAFVSYTVGNVMSVQLFETAERDIPGLRAGFTRGEFAPLLKWMNEHVHAHGAKFEPGELIKLATGSELTAKPYTDYIKKKFTALYGL